MVKIKKGKRKMLTKTKPVPRQETKIDTSKKRILIVDDHPVTRRGLVKIINEETNIMVVGEAENHDQAIEAIKKLKPDLVIADISLKNSSGLELTKTIKKQYPALPVLIQSMHDETMYSERALQAGAMGYVMKDAPTESLLAAVRAVLAGRVYTSEKMATKLVDKIVHGKSAPGASPIDSLSDRELEVFNLLGKGFGTSQIAEKLKLSIKTVETYRAHLKEKLALVDANELRQYAIQWLASRNE